MKKIHDNSFSFILLNFDDNIEGISHQSIYERAISIFYSKDYTITQISSYRNNQFQKAILASKENSNSDELRSDAIYMMDSFYQGFIFAKYSNEKNCVRINKNGSETLLEVLSNHSDSEADLIFIHEGSSFQFKEMKRYYFPDKKEDLKIGMIVEYFDNKKWVEKPILNLDSEYEKLYKLLIKYKKLRIEVN